MLKNVDGTAFAHAQDTDWEGKILFYSANSGPKLQGIHVIWILEGLFSIYGSAFATVDFCNIRCKMYFEYMLTRVHCDEMAERFSVRII